MRNKLNCGLVAVLVAIVGFWVIVVTSIAHCAEPAEALHPFWSGPVYGVFTNAGPDSVAGPRAEIHVPIAVAVTNPIHVHGLAATIEAQFQWTTKAYLGEASDPLRDAAYNWFPYLRIARADSSEGAFQWLKAGLDHLSNGADRVDSRSMNGISGEIALMYRVVGIYLHIYVKGWVMYDYGDNPGTLKETLNLADNVGGRVIVVGSLSMLDIAAELGPEWQNYMAYVPLHEFYKFGLYGQVHHGKFEGLLDYGTDDTTVSAGFALRPKL